MHEKAKFVYFIYMQPQKMKFKSIQINMKQVSYTSQEDFRRGFSKITSLSKEKGWIHKLQERTSKGNGSRGANDNPFCKYKFPNIIIF